MSPSFHNPFAFDTRATCDWGCRPSLGIPVGLREEPFLDVFRLRDEVVRGYSDYVRSFHNIADPNVKGYVEGRLAEGHLCPEALVQLNPVFEPGTSIDELVTKGLLHPEASRVFRRRKEFFPACEPFRLHRHQEDAVRAAHTGESNVLTIGICSGKCLAYFLPIANDALPSPASGRVKAIVVYPMDALCNSQR